MSLDPSWTLRCTVCKAQFGPLRGPERVRRLLGAMVPLDCGHTGAEVVSESF